jgi:hypothetical protein
MRLHVFVGAAFAGWLCASSPALASPYIVTLEEVGSNVVATGSGQIDLTGLNFVGGPGLQLFSGFLVPANGDLLTGGPGGSISTYSGALSRPFAFGSGGLALATSGSGDPVRLEAIFGGYIEVPYGYVSNDP